MVCGFMLKLYGAVDQPEFLRQLHSVGVLAQFEGLLSTYGTHTHTHTGPRYMLCVTYMVSVCVR